MVKNVTTIPATRNRFTADPISSRKSGRWLAMPTSAPTWRTSRPATPSNAIIIPPTYGAGRIGNLSGCIWMKASARLSLGTVGDLIKWWKMP